MGVILLMKSVLISEIFFWRNIVTIASMDERMIIIVKKTDASINPESDLRMMFLWSGR